MRRWWFLLAAVALLAGCADDGGLKENKAVARAYITEVFLQGNWDLWDRYFSETVIYNGLEFTRDDLMRNLSVVRRAFPDFNVIIEEQIGEGNRVLTRLTFTGTHTGPYLGIPPTGNRVIYRGLALDRIVDGKVVEMWHESDTWAMLQQMEVR